MYFLVYLKFTEPKERFVFLSPLPFITQLLRPKMRRVGAVLRSCFPVLWFCVYISVFGVDYMLPEGASVASCSYLYAFGTHQAQDLSYNSLI